MKDVKKFIEDRLDFNRAGFYEKLVGDYDELLALLYIWIGKDDVKNVRIRGEYSNSYIEFGDENDFLDFNQFLKAYSSKFPSDEGHIIPEIPKNGVYTFYIVSSDIEDVNDDGIVWKQWKDIVEETNKSVFGIRSATVKHGEICYYIKSWAFCDNEDAIAFQLRKNA